MPPRPLPQNLTTTIATVRFHPVATLSGPGRPQMTPEKAHLEPKLAQPTEGFPEKPHLKSPFFPGTSHDDLQTAPDEAKLDRFCSPRKASPSINGMQSQDLRDVYLRAQALPVKLHLRGDDSCARSPNPLTLFPDAAHASPRIPSRVDPANAHLASRKASPNRALGLIQQGFAVALTFLTRVSRVFTSMTLKNKTVCLEKNGSPKTVPSRETTVEAGIEAFISSKSISWDVYLALFHETSRQSRPQRQFNGKRPSFLYPHNG